MERILRRRDNIFKKKSDKLVILGGFDSWVDAPFDDDSFEIWSMNYFWEQFEEKEIGRADVWWEIHTLKTRKEEHVEWMKNATMPILMQHRHKAIPMSIKYPLKKIIEKYGRRYFLCTMNYQIALAMYMDYKEIHMYGFNMILGDDLIQRWSVEYWLGRAEQQGIKIVLPDDCDLLKSPRLYGYEADNTLAVYISRYMRELERELIRKVYAAYYGLESALAKMLTLSKERPKFMEEVFRRHGLKVNIQDGDDDECSSLA